MAEPPFSSSASPSLPPSSAPRALADNAPAPAGHAAPRRVVLVTGAAKRLGRHIALHLATQGWDVALHCHRSLPQAQATAQEVRALGVRAAVLAADLADEAATRALLPAAVAALGQVDAVVNNASVFAYDDARSVSHASLAQHWRTNTAAPVLLAQALAEHLQERASSAAAAPQGCVVNLLDQKLFNPNPDYFAYTLSKAALLEATRLLAQALAPRVRVCGVAPGLTLTSELIAPERLQQLQAQMPLGHGVAPEDVAQAVAYLLSARSVTGHVLVVDAGSHLFPATRDFAFLPS